MNHKEIIENTIKELLKKMNFNGDVFIEDADKDNIFVNIQTKEASFLIGQSGMNLEALQHLARVLVSKRNNQTVNFILDINSYKKQRIESLRELAGKIAEQTTMEKVAITLRPMSAYERRVIHLALFDNPHIKTESVGEGLERRIVVKPIK